MTTTSNQEPLQVAKDALQRIALNICGDTAAQVIAGEAMDAITALQASATNNEPLGGEKCERCDGEGAIGTGIEEAPTALCAKCNGTGFIAFRQQAGAAGAGEVKTWQERRKEDKALLADKMQRASLPIARYMEAEIADLRAKIARQRQGQGDSLGWFLECTNGRGEKIFAAVDKAMPHAVQLYTAPAPQAQGEPVAKLPERMKYSQQHSAPFVDGFNVCLERCQLALLAAPAPQADEVRDAARYLLPDDLAALKRFYECCEDTDSGGHDVPKDRMRRLAEIGVVRSAGFGRHEITAFGDYVLGRASASSDNFKLPLKTFAEYNAESALRTTAADNQKGGAANV